MAEHATLDAFVKGFIDRIGLGEPTRPIKLMKEADEFCQDPGAAEGADVLLSVLIELAQRGVGSAELFAATRAKAAENLGRSWVQQADGTFQHVGDPDGR